MADILLLREKTTTKLAVCCRSLRLRNLLLVSIFMAYIFIQLFLFFILLEPARSSSSSTTAQTLVSGSATASSLLSALPTCQATNLLLVAGDGSGGHLASEGENDDKTCSLLPISKAQQLVAG